MVNNQIVTGLDWILLGIYYTLSMTGYISVRSIGDLTLSHFLTQIGFEFLTAFYCLTHIIFQWKSFFFLIIFLALIFPFISAVPPLIGEFLLPPLPLFIASLSALSSLIYSVTARYDSSESKASFIASNY